MKWKIAGITLATIAMATAPLSGAAPAADGNGNKPVTPPGQTISGIAKSGGGPAGILSGLISLKPNNKGLQNALAQVTKPKPNPVPKPVPDPVSNPKPNPTPNPIAVIAKSGGGPAAILSGLISLKPNNKGLQNALAQVTKPKPNPVPTPTPTPTPEPTP